MSKNWESFFKERERGLIQDLWDSLSGHQIMISRILRYTPYGQRVCEMGVGRGHVLLLLAEKGLVSIGIDSDAGVVSNLQNLSKRFDITVETHTQDFFSEMNFIDSVYTIYNSGVMEHFSLSQIETLILRWSKISKYIILSIPYKSVFSSVKMVYGDENFYTYEQFKKLFSHIKNIEIVEGASFNHSFSLYNKLRKPFLLYEGHNFLVTALNFLLKPFDILCGNELLFVLRTR